MELRGIGTTRRQRPVGAISPTPLENQGKRFITIDPTIGSRSSLFQEFPKAIFDAFEWNRYDTPTASGRGHSTNSAIEPGQKVHNYRSNRWIALNFLSRVSGGCFRWSCVESIRHADGVWSGPFHRQRKRTGSKGP